MTAQSRSKWRVTLLRIIAAISVALLTGEAAVRITSGFLPEVRYLSTVRVRSRPQHFPTLEAFLKAQTTHLVPFRNWHNYLNNSLGFNDAEFDVPKPPGRCRIVALGDSFCFSMAPYPDTDPDTDREAARPEVPATGPRPAERRRSPTTGPWEYRTLLDLLDFPGPGNQTPWCCIFAGSSGTNGPGPVSSIQERPPLSRESRYFHSSFLTYVRNAVKLLRSRAGAPPRPPPRRSDVAPRTVGEKGGEIVGPGAPSPLSDLRS